MCALKLVDVNISADSASSARYLGLARNAQQLILLEIQWGGIYLRPTALQPLDEIKNAYELCRIMDINGFLNYKLRVNCIHTLSFYAKQYKEKEEKAIVVVI